MHEPFMDIDTRDKDATLNLDTSDVSAGLYAKYTVQRNDGRDRPGGPHDGCDLFVLDLTHDPHALPAIRAYIVSCQPEFPVLAQDLEALLPRLEVQDGPMGGDAEFERAQKQRGLLAKAAVLYAAAWNNSRLAAGDDGLDDLAGEAFETLHGVCVGAITELP